MKHLKAFGIAAAALVALMAFAGVGSATATELTCVNGSEKVMCPVGTQFHAESAGKIVMDSLIGSIECSMAFEGEDATTGSSTTTVSVSLSAVAFSFCNVGAIAKKPGSLEIHTENANADGNSTITWKGAELQINGCTYTTGAGVDLGTLTGSSTTHSTATLDVGGAIPGDGIFCGQSIPLTGIMRITVPDWLDVD